MKRFHVHLGVPDLAASVRFYSDLFGMPPAVAKPDYAKSNKHWVRDPQGIAWEAFHSLGTVPFYGDGAAEAGAAETACCADPQATAAACWAPAKADAHAATGCCAPASANGQPATAPRAACCR